MLANTLALALLAIPVVLVGRNPDLYHRIIQEDEIVEWATFWCFFLASGVFGFAAFRRLSDRKLGALSLAGVALFCLFFALEEISYGQRLVGFRPPEYFLSGNYQQELNLHNLAGSGVRKFVFRMVMLGYGVVLPLLGHFLRGRSGAGQVFDAVPPVGFVPIFLAAFTTYQVYPWRFTGEWVELLVGIGFLFTGVVAVLTAAGPSAVQVQSGVAAGLLATTWLAAIGAGAIQAHLWRLERAVDPERVSMAEVETRALRRDLLDFAARRKSRITRCGTNMRLLSFVRGASASELSAGHFASLTARGLPKERAEFFIDPWNSPYLVRHWCSKDQRRMRVYVYSSGPNRRRDSIHSELGGDDIGSLVASLDD